MIIHRYDSMLGRDGVDFLSSLLRWDPTDRLTPAQALQHSFLRKRGSAGCGHGTDASRVNPNNDDSDSYDDAETSEASRQQDKLHAVHMNSISDNLLSPLSNSSAFKLDGGYQDLSFSQCSSLPAPSTLSSSSSSPSSQFSMSDKFDFGPYRCVTDYSILCLLFASCFSLHGHLFLFDFLITRSLFYPRYDLV